MSNLYVTEPPTRGKVLIATNRGEIEVELWSKEAPKAVRNFIQLCLEGYYIDTIFHRIVPDFIIQGGDPTGTGTGGQSIYDEPFQDEFHSRLKYNRRGLLGMANNGKNDNGSQFFITLESTPELQNKNTLFGRVMGDTIYNVTKMGKSELEEGTERPLYPPKITKCEVLVNPFPDIVPRTTREELLRRQEAQQKANRPAARAVKNNKKLLSFMDDGNEEEEAQISFKSKAKSSHDLLKDERLASSEPSVPKSKASTRKRKITTPAELVSDEDSKPKQVMEPVKSRTPSKSPSPPPTEKKSATADDSIQAQIQALTSSLRRKKDPAETQPLAKTEPKPSHLQEQKLKYAKKAILGGRKKRALDESDTLHALQSFRSKLTTSSPAVPIGTTKEGSKCALHGVPDCQSCTARRLDQDDEEEEDGGKDWITHTLVCEVDKLGKDESFRMRAEQELEIIDPREKAGQIALAARQSRREADEKSGRNQYLQKDSRTNPRLQRGQR